MNDDYSSVLHALRIPGDEVQFGAVVAAVCGEPAAARELVQAVLENASCGNGNACAAIEPVPADVQLRREERLAEVAMGRRSLRGRARRAGRTDLDIIGQGWRLIVELKIHADINPAQVDRYLQEAPTAVVARVVDDTEHLARWQEHENWLGVTKWSAILHRLYDLPLVEPVKGEWIRLLRVLERDGDFREHGPRVSAETEAAAAVLSEVSEPLLQHVQRELVRVHGTGAESFASEIRAFKVSQGKAWAWVAYGVTSKDWIFDLSMRDMFKRAPVLQLDRQMYRDVPSGRRRRNQERNIGRQLSEAGEPVIRAPLDPALREPGRVVEWASKQLTRLVEHGAFRPDLERYMRHHL